MRKERDSMGEMQVPDDAYYGAQTQRAIENFPVSGIPIPTSMIRALGMIKRSAAVVNHDLGNLDEARRNAIIEASDEVIAGKFDAQFLVDIFQTGSGTSSNMNTNEIIANRASEIMGGVVGSREPVHPNDLHATMLHCFGLDHEQLTYRFQGRDFRLTDNFGNVVKDIIA